MKISHELRSEIVMAGLEAKAQEFRNSGSALYHPSPAPAEVNS